MTDKDNIYKKLQIARHRLNESGIVKTGKNAFGTSFKYFELGDFMPQVNEIFNYIGLFGYCDFSGDSLAILNIVNTENPEETIAFSCVKAEAGLRQGTPIQNIGAQQTYLRRYLWVQAMEITEDDQVDSLPSDQKLSQADINKKISKPETAKQPTLPELKERLARQPSLETLSMTWAGIPNKYKVQELINFAGECKKKLQSPESKEDWIKKIEDAKSLEEVQAIYNGMTPEDQIKYNDAIDFKIDSFRN